MRSRKVWIVLSILLGASLLAVAWTGWTAYRVNQDLSAAVDDAASLRRAIEAGDDAASDAALARLGEHSGAAADRTSRLTWSMLEHVPSFGDDARGVAVVSSVIDELSQAGIRPLVQVSGDLESIVPMDGKVDVAAVQDLQEPVAAASSAFDRADDRLSAEDSDGYVDQLRSRYRKLAGDVSDAARALRSADTAVKVMPAMLGADGAQNYLLVFQNNAEVRATGGLPGAVSLVRADDGEVRMTRQVAANSFGYTDRPVLPLTPAEKELYGDIVGTFFLNANLQPDFPRASDLWKARWEQEYPEQIDGVLSIDPVALSYVLGATGPFEVQGTTLTEDNVVDELLHEVYLRYERPSDQDAFFRAVARTMFDRIAGGAKDPRELMAALSRGAREHRVYVHDFDDQVQAQLAGSGVAGELVTESTDDPQVGVYLTDATGAKMSYFLRYDVDVNATYCTDGVQGIVGRASLTSDAPPNAASLPDYITGAGIYGTEPGTQAVFVRIYGPVGGSIDRIMFNGRPMAEFGTVDDRGRPVSTLVASLKPHEKVDISWSMKSGPGQTGSPTLSVTPSVEPGSKSGRIATACG